MRIPACLLAAPLAALALNCAAAPFTVRLGVERLVLDTPPGFTDTTDLASPRLQDLSETLTPASNRILVFALSDSDVRRFTMGDRLDARRYMIAVTPRGLENVRVSPDQFAALVAESLQGLGKPIESPDLIKFLAAQPIGALHLVAELKREPAAVSVLQALRLPPLPGSTFWESPKPQYQCFTTTLLLVRGKALSLSVYTLYDSPADIDWLKTITQRWQDELLRLNR
ncbi:MAG TPA: hypothetical protein VMU46_06690 [Burkholderiales bacterium]|nr:hypothetical protein [Burkholderiales bacterium]